MRSYEMELDGSRVIILATVKGLVKEGPAVRKKIMDVGPDIVALAVPPEELAAMHKADRKGRRMRKDKEELSNYEEIYALKLSKFGDVKAPPPCIVSAYKAARRLKIEVEAMDLDNEDYSDVYIHAVSTSQLIAHSFKWRTLKRKKFKADTAEEFVLEWDKEVTKQKGFRTLEEARERFMAKKLRKLAKEHATVVAVIELERAKGVKKRLGTTA